MRLGGGGGGEEEESFCVSVPENHDQGVNSKSLDDPLPILRESISFGRYASESLDWGKWSSFCQNRYLEEAEKCSTRGSVAQKKAQFEAHYKRIAEKKAAAAAAAAAALLDQQNYALASADHNVSESNNSREADLQLTESNDHLASHDPDFVSAQLNQEAKDGVTRDSCKIEDNIIDSSSPAEVGVISEGKSDNNLSTPLVLLENIDNENRDVEVQLKRHTSRKKSPLKENCSLNQDISSSPDIKRKSNFFKSPFLKKTSKALPSSPETRTPTSCKKEKTPISSVKTSEKHAKNDKRSNPQNPQIIRSLYQNCEISHPVSKPCSPTEKVRNARSSFSCFKSFDISNSLKTPTKNSANERSKVVQASLPSSEKRRRKPLKEGKSENRKSDVKQLLNPAFGKSTTSYSAATFCFWSKERTEKRKEFVLKLEEKLNAQRLERKAKDKEKAENELKLARQSLGLKAKPMPDFSQQ